MAKILFIDDDTNTLALMEKITEILGHQAITCPQANQALDFTIHDRPDMVMVDVNMQEISGFDVVKKIRKNLPENNLPILIISASDPDLETQHALDAGANGYLPKPLTINSLSDAISTFHSNGNGNGHH